MSDRPPPRLLAAAWVYAHLFMLGLVGLCVLLLVRACAMTASRL